MAKFATLYLAGHSKTRQVKATFEQGMLSVFCANDGEQILTEDISLCQVDSALGNLPGEIKLPQGELLVFPVGSEVMDDVRKSQTKAPLYLNFLEQNKLFWLIALILVPISFYGLVQYVIPSLAMSFAKQIPYTIKADIDEQVLVVYDKAMLDETEIGETTQQQIQVLWQDLLEDIYLDKQQFTLLFRKSDALKANAFALPGGTIVVTDELVNLLVSKPDALEAILLHEIAHVELNHSMRVMAESLGTTLLMTYFFGDLDGLVEVFSGMSVTLLQNNYSRDLEANADAYAFKKLKQLNKSPLAFAKAMTLLSEQTKDDKYDSLLKYFSTHPSTKSRIEKAESSAH
ncbi:M48 family metallopeptidase [Thalassomonas sp. M1454]|uniref:M48 family metallopeptidase n=1 Tax=Thalassomonas sp. M1454 TaxID=2594477 RepID=UPI00117D8BED|nr:M48 family metallopeptidase [Thalassomonas sp. M1454]TRX55188.1 M48 family metallopeptidase [Thalassomonas sp. M1454]